MAHKPFLCGACKKSYATEQAIRDHINSAHPKAGNVGIYQRISSHSGPRYDDEPSMAERAIDAQIARACGEHTDDAWLLGDE